MTFTQSLAAAWQKNNSLLCVGLDPDPAKFPAHLKGRNDAILEFCSNIVDATADLVCSFKPQIAYFAARRAEDQLEALIAHIHDKHPGIPVILDAKRGDIGTTAEAYADGMLGPDSAWGADALTINPYLGDDSLTPFVDTASARGAGLFVLVKTSNPGGKLIQDLVADGEPIYRHIARHVEGLSTHAIGTCGYGSVGAVVGATYPAQLAELRTLMPHTWLLVPGYGAQGGAAADVAAAFDSRGLGALVNNSRGIIFAHARKEFAAYGDANWQDAVTAATKAMIAELAAAHPKPTRI